MAHHETLGRSAVVDLPSGARLAYHEHGQGSPVVFVHGLLVNALLWRGVSPVVATAGHRCITPDWPFGTHEIRCRPTWT